MYEFAGSKSAKLVVTESGKLVAPFLQYIACLTRVQIYNKISHVALCFAVFHNSNILKVFSVTGSLHLRSPTRWWQLLSRHWLSCRNRLVLPVCFSDEETSHPFSVLDLIREKNKHFSDDDSLQTVVWHPGRRSYSVTFPSSASTEARGSVAEFGRLNSATETPASD